MKTRALLIGLLLLAFTGCIGPAFIDGEVRDLRDMDFENLPPDVGAHLLPLRLMCEWIADDDTPPKVILVRACGDFFFDYNFYLPNAWNGIPIAFFGDSRYWQFMNCYRYRYRDSIPEHPLIWEVGVRCAERKSETLWSVETTQGGPFSTSLHYFNVQVAPDGKIVAEHTESFP